MSKKFDPIFIFALFIMCICTLVSQIHFVHYKKSYGSFGEAVKHGDGLAVVGAFLDVSDDGSDHKALSSDIQKLSQISSLSKYTFVIVRDRLVIDKLG